MENQNYDVEVIGRQVQVTNAMKQYAKEKFSKVDRFQDHIMYMHVTMDIQHLEHVVTCIVQFDHFKIKSVGASSDMYASVDLAVERLQRQIRKWKGRIRDYRNRKADVREVPVQFVEDPYKDIEEFNSEIEAQNQQTKKGELDLPKVVGCKVMAVKTLTVPEAMMKLELSKDSFLIYRSEEDRKLKVMYVRPDGTYGIIQPE